MRSEAWDQWVARGKATNIADFVAKRGGLNLKRIGKELVGPCPVCGGNDRFAVSPEKGVFNCRGCGKAGDVIALVEHLDRVDFAHAVETLTGEPPPKTGNGKDPPPRAKDKLGPIVEIIPTRTSSTGSCSG